MYYNKAMPAINNFREASLTLERYWPKHLPPLLRTTERTKRLLEFLDNPQEKVRVVHVAGTSGKTSTAYYAAGLLHATHHTVGLMTSPYVDEVNERVQIGMVPLEESVFCRDLAQFLDLVEESHIKPHYFEIIVAFAFWEFARHRLEYAVIEVGMGGLNDPTNVVERSDKVCVITDIGLDHQQRLGTTLPEITAHKAGIIRWHNTVFCHQQSAAVMRVIQETAERRQADLQILSNDAISGLQAGSLPLFQQRNFALAYAAVSNTLPEPIPIRAMRQAIKTYIPARMEVVRVRDKILVLDGAHNPQKMSALTQSMRSQFGDVPVAALVSFAPGTGRATNNLQQLTPFAEHVTLTAYGQDRHTPFSSITRDDLVQACRDAHVFAYEYNPDTAKALQTFLARPEPILLVTGSFFLISEVRRLLASAV